MALQKEGVILAAEGADQFIAAMGQASKALSDLYNTMAKGQTATANIGTKTDEATSKFAQFFGGLRSGAMEAGGLESTLASLSGGMTALGGIVGALVVQLGQKLVQAIGRVTNALVELAKQTAPIQGLMFQFENLTASFEGGTSAMLASLQKASYGMISNRELMMKYNQAASLVNLQFAEKLPQALNLLTKVSTATGRDMQYLFDSYIWGVGRMTPRVIDNLDVQISLAEVTRRSTEEFGKQEEQLTTTEKQMMLMNMTLEKLEAKYGAMPDITNLASTQMAVLSASMQNIKDTLGQFLLPAWSTFLQAVNSLVSAFQAAISEGGRFYPLLVNIGAYLSIAADAVKVLVNVFLYLADQFDKTLNLVEDKMGFTFGKSFPEYLANAANWGIKFITDFATGIMEGASTVLVEAMKYIQNLLVGWLLGASPPKVAPDIEKWGIALFARYLKGMTEADFGVLESVQGPLKKILTGREFADISKTIAGALAGGDRARSLEILTNSSKIFGAEIAELARREFALADAVTAVEEAEKRLEAAREKALRSQRQVGIETAKYNEMLRKGASKEMLDAQLARINAAEKEAQATRDEASAAETGLEDAKSRVDALKEQVEWQKRFLEQLFGINDALTDQEKQKRERKKKEKLEPPIEEPEIVPLTAALGGGIAAAIEAAKERIKDALKGVWETIKKSFVNMWETALESVGKVWDQFKETVGGVWDALKEKYPFLQTIEDWLTDLPGHLQRAAGEWGAQLHKKLEDFWTFIQDKLIPKLNELWEATLTKLDEWLGTVQESWGVLKEKMDEVWTFITDDLIPSIMGENGLGPVLQWLNEKVIVPLRDAFGWLVEKLQAAKTWIDNVIKALKQVPSFVIGKSPSPLAIGIESAADAMERMARVSIPAFNRSIAFQPAAVGTFRQPAGATYNSTANSFSFQTSVNNGMDAAAFEAMVLRTVRRALAGAA